MSQVKKCSKNLKEIIGHLKLCSCEVCFLSKGSYGLVFSGKFKSKSDPNFLGISTSISTNVAVYRVAKSSTRVEIDVLRKVNGHRNIQHFYGAEEDDTKFWYIAAEMCAGTLADLVSGKYKGLPVGNNRRILHQIVSGVAHLHANDIIHRNLQPESILISIPKGNNSTNRPVIKLADIGMSRIVSDDAMIIPFGTDGWIAPEVLNGEKTCTDKMDIFPLGLLLSFILSGGRHPYGDDETMRNERIKNNRPTLTHLVGSDLLACDLIQSMLSADPKKRPSAARILKEIRDRDVHKENELLDICRSYDERTKTFIRFIKLVQDDEAVDVNCTDKDSYTPFTLLSIYYEQKNFIRYVEILLQRSDFDINQSLKSLCRWNFINTADILQVGEMLLAKGACVKKTNTEGMDALMVLCASSQSDYIVQMAMILIENGAVVHRKDNAGKNSLMRLCWTSRSEKIVEVAELLIANGADVHQTDKDGMNALMLLSLNSRNCKIVDVAKLLIQTGGFRLLNHTDKDGENALMHLCYHSESDKIAEMAKLFIFNGLDVSQTDKYGRKAADCLKDRLSKLKELQQTTICQLLQINYLR